uniref:Adenylate kinase n=1 Tax=candidate division WOR-3 bacterium TaxID=2052148 RepID=A0A7V3V0N9_UNCW3
MFLVLLGPPGSGKGTQAEMLASQCGFVHYSTGEVFREQISKKTELGRKVESYVVSGGLVPDQVVLAVVEDFIRQNLGKAIVFDGFPRTVPQAEGMDRILAALGLAVNGVALIDLSDEEVIRRLSSRRQCRNCGKIYNLSFSPPRQPGVCDECGGELYQRKDDEEATIRSRLRVYKEQTSPLINYYQQQRKLVRIDGALGRDRVFNELRRMIEKWK